MRVSKRAGLTIGAVAVAVLAAFAYGGYKRQAGAIASARESPFQKKVAPADTAAKDVLKDIPAGAAPVIRNSGSDTLHPPDTTNRAKVGAQQRAPCGFDPRTGQPFRFNLDTGQPCTAYPDRAVVRQPTPSPYYGQQPGYPPAPEHQMTPEERQIAAAYAREMEARSSPLTTRSSSGNSSPFAGQIAPGGSPPSGADAQSIVQALANRPREAGGSELVPAALNGSKSEYDNQNAQTAKTAFLASARDKKTDDYLQSTRTQPLSPYEIKAGWEIPAVLEQGLNSDLPGELKALVSSNIFDTATGKYLLIPQGSRLIGSYDSRVSYGQDGVMVVWQRIIYPDASSVDIGGMVGLDSHGNAGLRDKVDRHYKRLFGFAALTSAFQAAFSLSQRDTQSALTYPSPTSVAGAAVGQELSQTGAQITRQNLNVQPTIKVPAGYQFTVRVNRDIVFESPYTPMEADPIIQPPGQLRRRTGFSPASP
jgi:type IV secretion system protein VirB10